MQRITIQEDLSEKHGPFFSPCNGFMLYCFFSLRYGTSENAFVDCFSSSPLNEKYILGYGKDYFVEKYSKKESDYYYDLQFNGDELPTKHDFKYCIVIQSNENVSKKIATQFLELVQRGIVWKYSFKIGRFNDSTRDNSGFLDGICNFQADDDDYLESCIFNKGNGPGRQLEGTFMVFRRYEEDLEIWNNLPDNAQEWMIGRKKDSGAFLDGGHHWSITAKRATDYRAHIRRARNEIADARSTEWQDRIYRRSVPFSEQDAKGGIRYGLNFVSLNRDPRQQTLKIHNERMCSGSEHDDLMLASIYVKPIETRVVFLPMNYPS